MSSYPVINMVATGQNIQQLRINAGLSVVNLQQIFGFSTPQAIYKWQRGTALPTLDNMVILATIFNTNIDDILVFS
ncbi:MAG: helix-turn-helix transcriptional regulator [Ruminococcus sp.]|nr:helix-turn-helix transcriptional regulator [Ruminococcus sp.]